MKFSKSGESTAPRVKNTNYAKSADMKDFYLRPGIPSPPKTVAPKSSFGGGFQIPKQQKTETKGTPPPKPETPKERREFQMKGNFISTLDNELSELRQEIGIFGQVDFDPNSESILHKKERREQQFGGIPDVTIHELEEYRISHETRLAEVEAEYYRQKQMGRPGTAGRGQALPEILMIDKPYQKKRPYSAKYPDPERQQFEKAFTNYLNNKSRVEIKGRPEEDKLPITAGPLPDQKTLLRWVFSKIDYNNSGGVSKNLLLKEFHTNTDLAKLFGLPTQIGDFDYVEKFGYIFDEITTEDELTFNEFITFFQVSKHKAAQKKQYEARASPTKKANLPKKEVVDPEKVCLLLPKQIGLMGTIFDFLDSKNDLTVARGELTTYLKQDERIVKLLNVDAVRISHFQTLSLEQMIDFIGSDGESTELITWKQFVDYFYTRPQFAVSKVDESRPGVIALEDDPRLNEIFLQDEYIQLLKQKYDTVPKLTNDQVSTNKYIQLLNEDPMARGLLGIVARQPSKGLSEFPKEETVAAILERITADGPTLISWDDFLCYLSVRGKPKPRELTHQTFVEIISGASPVKKPPGVDFFTQTDGPEDSAKDAKRPITDIPINEEDIGAQNAKRPPKGPKDKTFNITVPKPFSMEMREKVKKMGVRQRWIANLVEEKAAEIQKECETRPTVKPIPPEVSCPMYNELLKDQLARQLKNKRDSKDRTIANEKPFNFYIRDLAKKKVDEIVKPKIPQFIAKPIPWLVTTPLYQKMLEEAAEKRSENVKKRAIEMLAGAKMPDRMERDAQQRKNEPQRAFSESDIFARFIAKPPPKFKDVDLEALRLSWPKKKTKLVPFKSMEKALQKAKENADRASSLEPVPEKPNRSEKWARADRAMRQVLDGKKNPFYSKNTKKWEDQVQLRGVVEAAKKAEEEKKIKEEADRLAKINAGKGRVQTSDELMDNARRLREEREATRKRKIAERKQMDKEYSQRIKDMETRTGKKNLLFEKPHGVLSTELARIKGIIKARKTLSVFDPAGLRAAKEESDQNFAATTNENQPPSLMGTGGIGVQPQNPTEVPVLTGAGGMGIQPQKLEEESGLTDSGGRGIVFPNPAEPPPGQVPNLKQQLAPQTPKGVEPQADEKEQPKKAASVSIPNVVSDFEESVDLDRSEGLVSLGKEEFS